MTTSPISNVINDILLTIFKTITEPMPSRWDEPSRSLEHVQAASQVCQRWRGLLLDSAGIWGRVIDLGHRRFGPERGKWIEEIIKRAGTSPLWIYGYVTKPKPYSGIFDSEALFIRLLESWERVEKLCVAIDGDDLSDHIQRHFLSRAPILKVFDVKFGYFQAPLFHSTLQPGSSQSLFADYAPSLARINACYVAFKLDSPWLSNVRDIEMPGAMTLQDALTLLRHTPLLSNLSLNETGISCDLEKHLEKPIFPRMFFSNLSTVDLRYNSLAVTAMILNHIFPGANLSVVRLSILYKEIPNSYTLSCLKKGLPSYISNYFTANPASHIKFKFPSSFFFSDNYPHISNRDHCFNIEKLDGCPEDIDVLSCLLDAFLESAYRDGCPSLFTTVTELAAILSSRSVLQSDILSKLYPMLAAFPSVQTLVTIEDSLSILCALSYLKSQELVLFPQLITVRLTYRYASYNGPPTFNHLLQFLLKRKEIGRPVAKLDLTDYDPSVHGVRNFGGLDRVDGLEVIWSLKTGKPTTAQRV